MFPSNTGTMRTNEIYVENVGKREMMAQEDILRATRIGRGSRESIVKEIGGHPREPLDGDSQEMTAFPEWALVQSATEVKA